MTAQQPAGAPGDAPQQHDFDVQKQLHQQIRNDPDYDDWEYGTEPLPHEAWVVRAKTLTQLYRHLIYVFATSDTICSSRLAELAIHEILKLRLTDLTRIRHQDPRYFA